MLYVQRGRTDGLCRHEDANPGHAIVIGGRGEQPEHVRRVHALDEGVLLAQPQREIMPAREPRQLDGHQLPRRLAVQAPPAKGHLQAHASESGKKTKQ